MSITKLRLFAFAATTAFFLTPAAFAAAPPVFLTTVSSAPVPLLDQTLAQTDRFL
jgi:hypothetical protein